MNEYTIQAVTTHMQGDAGWKHVPSVLHDKGYILLEHESNSTEAHFVHWQNCNDTAVFNNETKRLVMRYIIGVVDCREAAEELISTFKKFESRWGRKLFNLSTVDGMPYYAGTDNEGNSVMIYSVQKEYGFWDCLKNGLKAIFEKGVGC